MKNKLSVARQLVKRPIKENKLETPHIQISEPNIVQQADILYLPSDHGFKYALVVVDLGSRLTDVIPLKSRTAAAIKKAFEKVYSGDILRIPKKIEVDNGAEFKGVTKEYFDSKDVQVRYGKVGRSRQQALAERRNQIIGNEILFNQLVREVETNKINKQWIKDLPEIKKKINDKYKVHTSRFHPLSDEPIITKRNKDLLVAGDQVRIILDKPQDYFGKKLTGRFRSADIRWSPKIYEIDRVLLRPGYPPGYIVKGLPHVYYTRGQLQLLN